MININNIALPKCKSTLMRIKEIINDLKSYDFNPPYQRGDVWKLPNQKKLIESILQDIPINTIHLVSTNKIQPKYYVLDGKQRLTAIDNFCKSKKDKNSFPVSFPVEGELKKIYFDELEEKFPQLSETFYNTQLNVVVWESCPFIKQKEIFTKVNYSKNINTNEAIFCKNYLTREFLEYIYKKSFKDLHEIFGYNSIHKEERFNLHRHILKTLILSFGQSLDSDQFDVGRSCKKTASENSASSIDEKIMSVINDTNTIINEKIVTKLGWDKIVDYLKFSSEWTSKGFNTINVIEKENYTDYGFIMDIICFLTKKQREEILNNNFIESGDNLIKLNTFIQRWHKIKYLDNNPLNYRKQTTNPESIKNKFTKMEEIFIESGFDNKQRKKTSYTKHDKLQAIISAPKECPATDKILIKPQFDHPHPNGTMTEKEPPIAVDPYFNLQKLNNDLSSVSTIQNYLNLFESEKQHET